MFAKPAHQTLGDDGADGGGELERIDLHPEQFADRADRVTAVDGGQYELAVLRGLNDDIQRFLVADFSDHDDIGVLP